MAPAMAPAIAPPEARPERERPAGKVVLLDGADAVSGAPARGRRTVAFDGA